MAVIMVKSGSKANNNQYQCNGNVLILSMK